MGEHEKMLKCRNRKTNINDLIYVTLAKSFGSWYTSKFIFFNATQRKKKTSNYRGTGREMSAHL